MRDSEEVLTVDELRITRVVAARLEQYAGTLCDVCGGRDVITARYGGSSIETSRLHERIITCQECKARPNWCCTGCGSTEQYNYKFCHRCFRWDRKQRFARINNRSVGSFSIRGVRNDESGGR